MFFITLLLKNRHRRFKKHATNSSFLFLNQSKIKPHNFKEETVISVNKFGLILLQVIVSLELEIQ